MSGSFLVLVVVVTVLPCAALPAGPVEPGYPRLAMWWPNSRRQPATELARYDLIAWGTWEREETLAEIKRLNPDQLHLVSISLTETSFRDRRWASGSMSRVPAEWFLTQRGSQLREAVDGAQTVLPVESTVAEDGMVLFAVGDTVACECESMKVAAVDNGARTITVERGLGRPASPHAAGVRIAAHITFWPGTWVMNISAMCPRVERDPAAGPQTWVEWGLRHLLPDNQRDGFCVDRVEPRQAWLVPSYARSIDPDCSNRPVTDNYAAFDRAWSEGIRSIYLPGLRRLLAGKLMISNTSGAFHDLLNGCIFEGFPGHWGGGPDSYRESWAQRAVGDPGLFVGVEKGLRPNFSWVETYESQAGPSADGTRHVPNPFVRAGFVPNYRRMRWGLTTALVAGAMFSHEMHTEGHGSLGLMWFDEYDNAGQGRHYLGMPVGDAQVVLDFGEQGRVYRRDYEHGIIICNPSDREAKVELGGVFRHIKGTQAPDVNNGREATLVTVGPMDGRILLR